MKILIVDDNTDFTALLKLMLENEGFDVRLANNGEDGYYAYLLFEPDLVITDIQMPIETGKTHPRQRLRHRHRQLILPILWSPKIHNQQLLPTQTLGQVLRVIAPPVRQGRPQVPLRFKHPRRSFRTIPLQVPHQRVHLPTLRKRMKPSQLLINLVQKAPKEEKKTQGTTGNSVNPPAHGKTGIRIPAEILLHIRG